METDRLGSVLGSASLPGPGYLSACRPAGEKIDGAGPRGQTAAGKNEIFVNLFGPYHRGREAIVKKADGTAAMAAIFDELAAGYDCAALRFFPFAADAMADEADLKPGLRVLDLATGTGAVATAVAQRIRPTGRVIGIDVSPAMLDRAWANVRRMALHNVDLHEMDAMAPGFRAQWFDRVLCGFGLFFLPDPPAALRAWARLLKPEGLLTLSVFARGAFEPFLGLLRSALAAEGGTLGDWTPPWAVTEDSTVVAEWLQAAGFEPPRVRQRDFGYHLDRPEDWWALLWNSFFRRLLESLPPDRREDFRQRHLAQVAQRLRAGDSALAVPVTFLTAVRAA